MADHDGSVSAKGWRWIAWGCVGLTLVAALASAGESTLAWVGRASALTALTALVASERFSRSILTNPAFLLLAVVLIFYCLLPALCIPWVYGPVQDFAAGTDPQFFRFGGGTKPLPPPYEMDFLRLIPGSAGERVLWLFVTAGIAILLFFQRCRFGSFSPQCIGGGAVAVLTITGSGLLYQIGKNIWPQASGAGLTAIDLCVPVILTQMAWLVGARVSVWWRGIGLTLGSVLLFPFMIKVAVLFLAISAVHGLVGLRGRTLWLGLAMMLALPVIGALGIGLAKGQGTMRDAIVEKLVPRQADTVFCLNFVLRQPPEDGSPVYMLGALIPRIVWPEKPSLSVGAEFARRYCGIVNTTRHSASVTLLGEPYARAGYGGMLMAGVILMALFGICTWASRRGGVFAVAALALSPYVVDFDQMFALYLAGMVRAAMVVSLMLWLMRKIGTPAEIGW